VIASQGVGASTVAEMKIILAKKTGFCFGVKRALAITNNSLEKDPPPIQLLGPLVHNEKVNQRIKKRGGKFVEKLEKIKSGTLIIRAHGISPALKNKIPKSVRVEDSTCPLVKKAQEAASHLFKKEYQLIIIGDKHHTETKAINGSIGNNAIIIENKSQAEKLSNIKKAGVVAQTTQNRDRVEEILKIIKKKSGQFRWIDTLCSEVSARQKELQQLIKKCDGILVVGSKTSANTTRLAEIAKYSQKPTWWINSAEEIKKGDFNKIESLAVTSGTSTPDWIIKKVVDKLKKI